MRDLGESPHNKLCKVLVRCFHGSSPSARLPWLIGCSHILTCSGEPGGGITHWGEWTRRASNSLGGPSFAAASRPRRSSSSRRIFTSLLFLCSVAGSDTHLFIRLA